MLTTGRGRGRQVAPRDAAQGGPARQRPRPPVRRVLVLVPTYNERDNLPMITARVRETVPEADILILEDNSPDGTGQIADALAAQDPRTFVLHRPGKEGLGRAYLAGFDWGLEHGYDALVEIDADGSHRPEHLPAMLAALADADVVIGSRWVPGGEVVNWPLRRKLLSVGANTYIRVMLGMPVMDATAGYRIYRAEALRTIGLEHVESHGYCFQTDLTWKAIRAGLRVVEVPISFVEREVGYSKMDSGVFSEALIKVAQWGAQHRARQVAGAAKAVRRRLVRGRPRT
ncbi:MAG: polyprenol monophosphomannose synthase [Austwickia sp.]|nr:polyprenol monophosphomannose synthase [Austwickia sp.]MBK9101174.1 polyprenol monophosphomannose synthase [Austwickia sp.]